MKTKDRCILFLEQNGWTCDTEESTCEYRSYVKDGGMSVDFNGDEMIFIDRIGDSACFYINYYTLIGFLMEHGQIECDYTRVR